MYLFYVHSSFGIDMYKYKHEFIGFVFICNDIVHYAASNTEINIYTTLIPNWTNQLNCPLIRNILEREPGSGAVPSIMLVPLSAFIGRNSIFTWQYRRSLLKFLMMNCSMTGYCDTAQQYGKLFV